MSEGGVQSCFKGWTRPRLVHPQGPGQSSIAQCWTSRCRVSFKSLINPRLSNDGTKKEFNVDNFVHKCDGPFLSTFLESLSRSFKQRVDICKSALGSHISQLVKLGLGHGLDWSFLKGQAPTNALCHSESALKPGIEHPVLTAIIPTWAKNAHVCDHLQGQNF